MGLSVALLVGCSNPAEGHADRTAHTGPEQALPSSSELSQALDMQMRPDAAVRVGGADLLRDSSRAVPQGCTGVAHSGDHQTYKDAHLDAVTQGSWITSGDGDPTHAIITVAEFSSPQDTHAWYLSTAADWQRCQGITVTERTKSFTFADGIERVEESAGSLNAELLFLTKEGLSTPMPHSRAVTAVSRYAVDVEVLGRAHPGADTLGAAAEAIARLVAGKITSVS